MGLFSSRAKEERKHDWQVRRAQWEQDKKVFDYTNEYNAPINQKQRLKDANLNPALMYESAPQNVASFSQSSSTPVTARERPPLEGAIGLAKAGYDAYMGIEQRNLIKSQIRKNDSDTLLNLDSKPDYLESSARKNKADAIAREIGNEYEDTSQKLSIEHKELQNEASKLLNKGTDLSNSEKEIRNRYLAEYLKYQNKTIKDNLQLLYARIKNVASDTALKDNNAKSVAVKTEIDNFERILRSKGTSFKDGVFGRSFMDASTDLQKKIKNGEPRGMGDLIQFLQTVIFPKTGNPEED